MLEQPNLSLYQSEVVGLILEKNQVLGIQTVDGKNIGANSVILTTGTFLNGLIHIELVKLHQIRLRNAYKK